MAYLKSFVEPAVTRVVLWAASIQNLHVRAIVFRNIASRFNIFYGIIDAQDK